MIQGVGPIEDDSQYLDRFSGILERSKYIEKQNNLNVYLYPRFPQIASEIYKTILFVGETGSGKTSSINFFLNYYLGVQFEDNIRFKLIDEQKQGGSQAVSQTQNVNIYYVKPINGHDGLRIVDTPGFNDTRGMSQDQKILDQIKNCFKKDIVDISAICFLIKATETRLTSSQQYVFSQIVQIFGKNILKNLIFLFTFCGEDLEEEPQALQIVKFKGDKQTQNQQCCLAEFYDQMVEPKYIKYDNKKLYCLNNKKGNKKKWQYFMAQFNELYEEKIDEILPVSLQLTLDVIEERKTILDKIKQMKSIVKENIKLIDKIKETYKTISQMEPSIIALKNYTYTKTVWRTMTVKRFDGLEKQTKGTSKKQQSKKPYNSNNPKKSQQTKQVTISYIPKFSDHQQSYQSQEIAINDEMKKQHDSLTEEKLKKEDMLKKIENDFFLGQGQYYQLLNEFQICARRLQEMALMPLQTNEQETEYIQKLLQDTLDDKEKVSLNEMMADLKMVEEITKQNGDSQKTQDFYNQFLKAKLDGTLQKFLSQA